MTDANQTSNLADQITIVPLDDGIPFAHFRCGESEIDEWVQKKAVGLYEINRVRIFCAQLDNEDRVVGFYALSLDSKQTKRLLPVFRRFEYLPVVYIQYIAVVRSLQRRKIGSGLLLNALGRAYQVAQHVGYHGVALRPLNDDTARLYSNYGFKSIDTSSINPLMILPMQALKDLISAQAA